MAAVLNNKAYIGLFNGSKKLWEWDIVNNIWTEKISFDGSSIRDTNLAAFAYENKVYFFRAKEDGGFFEIDPRMELWSFDPNLLK